ncbi:hypothetical protein NZD88_02075 [Chryseobacterium antibioticum]|uniref:Uncharacterized protein n=1 Tax=Chryseobacterium pyrolae TaxID=2987481 RepID=A0ABT2ICI2_9FLAO|nr:hypothetical protein [Chryseobacterium pyrolae]MCT2406340.1 hypothetical protein [Chryseobacterium pyrolae]
MKKVLLTLFMFCCTFLFSQKNLRYVEIYYGSICCGTASTEPVTDYLKQFEKKNKLKALEVLIQRSKGREGEFSLYIGVDKLNKKQQKLFMQGLSSAISIQNSKRNEYSDGTVNFDSAVTFSNDDLKNRKNLTIYK